MTTRIYEPSTTGDPIDPRAYADGRNCKSYGPYAAHLDVLEEWNEVRWEPINLTIQHTDMGIIVTSNCRMYEYRGLYEKGPDFRHVDYDTVVAMYADDDLLYRIVCLANDRTSIVFESDRPMRG